MSKNIMAMGTAMLLGIHIYLLVKAALFHSRLDREQNIVLTGRGKLGLLALCAANALVVSHAAGGDPGKNLLLSQISGALLFACVTDCCMQQVYQFTWWWAGAAGILLFLTAHPCVSKLFLAGELLVFCLLQELIFCRMYGRADCHGFCACATVLLSMGGRLEHCILHTVIAFGMLAVVQGLRGNVGKGGRLRQPVAFLPYITVSFWLLLSCPAF